MDDGTGNGEVTTHTRNQSFRSCFSPAVTLVTPSRLNVYIRYVSEIILINITWKESFTNPEKSQSLTPCQYNISAVFYLSPVKIEAQTAIYGKGGGAGGLHNRMNSTRIDYNYQKTNTRPHPAVVPRRTPGPDEAGSAKTDGRTSRVKK